MHHAVRHKTRLTGIDAISMTSDRSFPRHSHDEFGFGYVVAGGQESWSGRGRIEAQAGDVITVNPCELHDGIGRTGEPRHWHMLYLPTEVVQKYLETPFGALEFHHPVLRSEGIAKAVCNALEAVMSEDVDPESAEEAVILAISELLCEMDGSNTGHRQQFSLEIATVQNLIEDQFEHPLSLEDFAQASGLSRYQVLRAFSRQVGTTPHAYLTQHRLKQARRMIRGGMPIAQAAIACGFADQSHLTRAYVRQFGMTPGLHGNDQLA